MEIAVSETKTTPLAPETPTTKLCLGAGPTRLKGFIHIDADPASHPDRILDITALDYPPNSVDVIYVSHTLEHLNPVDSGEDRLTFLKGIISDWRKCLKPGGKLYIAVPDIERLANVIRKFNDFDVQWSAISALFGGARNPFDCHFSGFTKLTLTQLLHQAGFDQVEEFEAFVEDESFHRVGGDQISLNLVATKPAKLEFALANSFVGSNEVDVKNQVADDGGFIQAPAGPELLSELTQLRIAADSRMAIIADMKKRMDYLEKRVAELEDEATQTIWFRLQTVFHGTVGNPNGTKRP